jgi:hypothetical protein
MNTDDDSQLRDDDCKVINVPDDSGTIKIGLDDCIYLKFTRAGYFTCSDSNSFSPPLPDTHSFHKGARWGPATPNSDYDGADIKYNLAPAANEPAVGKMSASVLSKVGDPILNNAGGHIIHIGSNTVNLLFVINRDPHFRDVLIQYWLDTKIFLSALVDVENSSIHADQRKFLESLIEAGDKAYAKKPTAEEVVPT